ncbi:cation:proton antiporter [Neobacillus sp. MER 74]|uniref:cation:proton antiporter n=1 Tax=Neobacillus sp. MER 74 TaxID=2939566 RepID=UPI00203E5D3F|nr:cation:proton antiporter [Neobacillus sp. MER 74]MCM3117788.1 cation:proton antiporter [Neobacillus sp. MER 74]
MELILELAIILFASKIAGDISVKLGQPSVLGKLLIGVIIGPAVLGLISETKTIADLSQIGVILLMFIAGLETDIHEFRRTWKASTFVGISGIIVPLLAGYLTGILLNMSTIEALFLGLLLSATSVSISVQALKELNMIQSKEGTTILGAAVIDDVLVIIALAFLMSMAGDEVNLNMMIMKKVLFFTVAILVAWKIVPWLLKKFAPLKVTESLVTGALIICFLFSFAAELTGVAGIIGAYIAGVAIGQTDYKHKIFKKVETISYSIFVPVFFTSIGLSVSFDGISQHLGLMLGLSILAILTKLIGAAAGAKIARFSWKNSLGIGAAMVSRGEVALIIATIGLESKLITEELFAVLVVVVLVTTIVTPPMMKFFFNQSSKRTTMKNTA